MSVAFSVQQKNSDKTSLWSLCRNVGSQWALDQAKYNLVNEYMLVGVTEELEDFVMMLEAALPRFFKGATDLYKTGAVITKHLSLHFLYLSLFVEAGVYPSSHPNLRRGSSDRKPCILTPNFNLRFLSSPWLLN